MCQYSRHKLEQAAGRVPDPQALTFSAPCCDRLMPHCPQDGKRKHWSSSIQQRAQWRESADAPTVAGPSGRARPVHRGGQWSRLGWGLQKSKRMQVGVMRRLSLGWGCSQQLPALRRAATERSPPLHCLQATATSKNKRDLPQARHRHSSPCLCALPVSP